MVPILEHYAVSGVVLTSVLLYVVLFAGARSANPLAIFVVMALTVIPVAGVAEQALSAAGYAAEAGTGKPFIPQADLKALDCVGDSTGVELLDAVKHFQGNGCPARSGRGRCCGRFAMMRSHLAENHRTKGRPAGRIPALGYFAGNGAVLVLGGNETVRRFSERGISGTLTLGRRGSAALIVQLSGLLP